MKRPLKFILALIFFLLACESSEPEIVSATPLETIVISEKTEAKTPAPTPPAPTYVDIEEIQSAPDFEVPENIYEAQLHRYFKQGDTYYVTVIQQVMWNPMFDVPRGAGQNYFTGILYAQEGDTQWKVFNEIVDVYPSRNLPVYFWNEGAQLYMAIADDEGAGSGEGILKVLRSSDNGKTWVTQNCYYAVGIPLEASVGTVKDPITGETIELSFDAMTEKEIYANAEVVGEPLDKYWDSYFSSEMNIETDPSCHNFSIQT